MRPMSCCVLVRSAVVRLGWGLVCGVLSGMVAWPAAAGGEEPDAHVAQHAARIPTDEPAAAATQDTAYLTGDRVLRGQVVEFTDTSLRFRTEDGATISVPLAEVVRIDKTDVGTMPAAGEGERRAEAERLMTDFERALQQPTWMRFRDIEITALGKFFSRVTDVRVEVDPQLRGQHVSVDAKNVPLKRVLTLCAEQLGGAVYFRAGYVEIRSE